MPFTQDVLLVNPSQQYPADKSNDASSSLRSTELNGFAYRSLDGSDGPSTSGSEAADRQVMGVLHVARSR